MRALNDLISGDIFNIAEILDEQLSLMNIEKVHKSTHQTNNKNIIILGYRKLHALTETYAFCSITLIELEKATEVQVVAGGEPFFTTIASYEDLLSDVQAALINYKKLQSVVNETW